MISPSAVTKPRDGHSLQVVGAQSAVMISQEDLLSLWKTVDNVLTRPDYAELTRVRLRQQTPLTVLPNSYQYGNQLFRELLPKLAEKNVLDGYDGFCEYHEDWNAVKFLLA